MDVIEPDEREIVRNLQPGLEHGEIEVATGREAILEEYGL
jgi:hypothetical protein